MNHLIVDDPLQAGRIIKVRDPNDPSPAATDLPRPVRAIRDDPIASMHARGQIDVAAYNAARHWQYAYEQAGGAGARAIDFTKEAVDGGRIADPFSDMRIRAIGDLRRASRVLGLEGDAIVHDVLGDGLTLAAAGLKRGYETEREQRYLGGRLRECLETLAKLFGYAA